MQFNIQPLWNYVCAVVSVTCLSVMSSQSLSGWPAVSLMLVQSHDTVFPQYPFRQLRCLASPLRGFCHPTLLVSFDRFVCWSSLISLARLPARVPLMSGKFSNTTTHCACQLKYALTRNVSTQMHRNSKCRDWKCVETGDAWKLEMRRNWKCVETENA